MMGVLRPGAAKQPAGPRGWLPHPETLLCWLVPAPAPTPPRIPPQFTNYRINIWPNRGPSDPCSSSVPPDLLVEVWTGAPVPRVGASETEVALAAGLA